MPKQSLRHAPTFTDLIIRLADKHGLNLKSDSDQLHLSLQTVMPLVIAKTSPRRLWIAHYYTGKHKVTGEPLQIPDPMVEFWIDDSGNWIPYAATMPILGFRCYVEFKNGKPVKYSQHDQHDLAGFCKTWGRNLREQGWLKFGEGILHIVQKDVEQTINIPDNDYPLSKL